MSFVTISRYIVRYICYIFGVCISFNCKNCW